MSLGNLSDLLQPYTPTRLLRFVLNPRVNIIVKRSRFCWFLFCFVFNILYPVCLQQFASDTPPLGLFVLFQNCPQKCFALSLENRRVRFNILCVSIFVPKLSKNMSFSQTSPSPPPPPSVSVCVCVCARARGAFVRVRVCLLN